MISSFVVRCLDSIISLLAIAEISRPKLVSVAEQASLSEQAVLSFNWSQTLKPGFLVSWLVYWPPHDKTNKMTCVPSLIRVFACAQRVVKDPIFLHADSKD